MGCIHDHEAPVKRASGVDFRVDFAARRPGDPARIVAAADRARALLGWEPSLAWERKRITLGSGQAHDRLISP